MADIRYIIDELLRVEMDRAMDEMINNELFPKRSWNTFTPKEFRTMWERFSYPEKIWYVQSLLDKAIWKEQGRG